MCGNTLRNSHGLKIHMSTVHGSQRNFKCDRCILSFKTSKILQEHVENIHEGKKHKCDICGKLFSQKSGIYTHMRSVHKLEQKQYVLKKHLIT